MDAKGFAQWAVGIALAVMLFRLLKKDTGEEQEERLADAVGKLWELKAGALQRGLNEGKVHPYQLEEIALNTAALQRMANDAHELFNAPASWYAWDDNERQAVASVVMRSTLPELLFFADYFANRYGVPVDAHLLSFMDKTGFLNDAKPLAFIAQHVLNLRNQ